MNNVRQPRTINASAGKLLSQVLVKVFEEVSDEDVKAAFSNRLMMIEMRCVSLS